MPADRIPEVKADAADSGASTSQSLAAYSSLRSGVESWTRRMCEMDYALEEQQTEQRQSLSGVFIGIIELLDKLDGWLSGTEAEQARASQDAAKWLGRLEMASKYANKILARNGVVPLDLIGAPPAGTVTVLDRVFRMDVDGEVVHEVVERGWIWKGEVLRKATVIVAVPPPVQAESSADTQEDT